MTWLTRKMGIRKQSSTEQGSWFALLLFMLFFLAVMLLPVLAFDLFEG